MTTRRGESRRNTHSYTLGVTLGPHPGGRAAFPPEAQAGQTEQSGGHGPSSSGGTTALGQGPVSHGPRLTQGTRLGVLSVGPSAEPQAVWVPSQLGVRVPTPQTLQTPPTAIWAAVCSPGGCGWEQLCQFSAQKPAPSPPTLRPGPQ